MKDRDRIASFLASHLVAQLREIGGEVPSLPLRRHCRAGLLLTDVSGFTSLTERLQEQGRGGAEEIGDLIGRCFGPLLDLLEHHGGSVASFGGDALFTLFLGGDGASRAVKAAEQIRRAHRGQTDVESSAGPVRITLSQAVHEGRIELLDLGHAARRHHVVAGPSVNALARLASRAGSGALLVSRAGRRAARRPSSPAERSIAAPKADAPIDEAVATALATYVSPRLRDHLALLVPEYRQATVLFFETRGWSLPRLQRFFLALENALKMTGGVLLKSDLSKQGCKWLCLFGVPLAQEDAPERALRTALEMRRSLPGRGWWRAGLSAGLLATIEITGGSRQVYDVMGDPVNVAARILDEAEWGEAWLSDGLRRLVPDLGTSSRGLRTVKGKARPLELVALQSLPAGAGRRTEHRATSLVGRDGELNRIREALRLAAGGQGATLAVEAEAGVGKSRLALEAEREARRMGFQSGVGRTLSFGSTPYWTIASLLRRLLGVDPESDADVVVEGVERESARLELEEADAHHLCDLLGHPHPRSQTRHLTPQVKRQNTMLAVRRLLIRRARHQPQLYVLEDLHWIDESSREAVEEVARSVADQAIVLLLLHRPGYSPPSTAAGIRLAPLSTADVPSLLAGLFGLPADEKLQSLVAQRSEGNPLYVEEMVSYLLETDAVRFGPSSCVLARAVGQEELPGRIEALIAARLDRLSRNARELAHLGSVIGRSFLERLICELSQEAAVRTPGLRELRVQDVILERLQGPETEYYFRHAMVRDVAYQTILQRRRRGLHRAVADAISTLFGADSADHQAALGRHWEEAGEPDRARACYGRAADHAMDQFALVDAEEHYRRAVRLASTPDRQSLEARSRLGYRVLYVQGRFDESLEEHRLGAEEAASVGERELEAEHVTGMGRALWGLGRIEEADELFRRAIDIFRTDGHVRGEAVARGNLAVLHANRSRLDLAREEFEQALQCARAAQDPATESGLLGNLALVYRHLEQLDESQRLHLQSLALKRKVGDRVGAAITLTNLAGLESVLGRDEAALPLFDDALREHRAVGNRPFIGLTQSNRSVALRNLHRVDEALVAANEALAIARELGARSNEAAALLQLARARMELGELDAARRLSDEAHAIYTQNGEQMGMQEVDAFRETLQNGTVS